MPIKEFIAKDDGGVTISKQVLNLHAVQYLQAFLTEAFRCSAVYEKYWLEGITAENLQLAENGIECRHTIFLVNSFSILQLTVNYKHLIL